MQQQDQRRVDRRDGARSGPAGAGRAGSQTATWNRMPCAPTKRCCQGPGTPTTEASVRCAGNGGRRGLSASAQSRPAARVPMTAVAPTLAVWTAASWSSCPAPWPPWPAWSAGEGLLDVLDGALALLDGPLGALDLLEHDRADGAEHQAEDAAARRRPAGGGPSGACPPATSPSAAAISR